MTRVRSVPAILAGLLLASPALGHEDDDPQKPVERANAPSYDPAEYRSKQYGAFEFRIGPYRPRVDEEFDGAATPFEDLFGDGQSVMFGFEADYQILRIPHFATLGPGIGWSFVTYAADSLQAADPSERVSHPTSIWIMPMYAVAVLRVDVLSRELSIPIVPYVKGGFSLALWKSEDAGETSYAGDIDARGMETGLQLMFGGMLHLNFFAKQRALDMDNSTGVNHAYLFGEWMMSDIDSFDQGMQVGTNTWQVGVAVEY